MERHGPADGILRRRIPQHQSHQKRVGRLQQVPVEQPEQERGTQDGKPLAVRPQRPQNEAPEDQLLRNGRQKRCVQEHADSVRAAGNGVQRPGGRPAEAVHHQLKKIDPNRIDHLGSGAQAHHAQENSRLHGLFPFQHLSAPELTALPGVQDHQRDGRGGDVPPCVSGQSGHVRDILIVSLYESIQVSSDHIPQHRHGNQNVHQDIVSHQRPANGAEALTEPFVDLFLVHCFPP